MFARLNAPIVLAHGLFGVQHIGWGQLTLTAYFRGIPERLRLAGNRVLAPQVPPIAGVELRAKKLGALIDEAFPGEPVHLIGHSMGGLDARLLASDPAWSARILSVTTIATPHLGSSLADFAKLRVGRVYGLLEALRIDYRGFLDLTRLASRDFHERVIVPDSIPCFSIAGNPPADEVCWPVKRLHEVMTELEGPNDGLVSVNSARAFGSALPDWPLDHLRQMDWSLPAPPPRLSTSRIELYETAVNNLASHGFAALEADDQALSISA